MLDLDVKVLPHFEGLSLPTYATEGSAGMDLRCALHGSSITLGSLERHAVPTGLSIALPPGYEAQIRPRSGLAARSGISIVNAPGTIDADYRGEIFVLLINLSRTPVIINRGDRIAQMVIAPVQQIRWQQVDTLPETDRGQGGLGHTGVK